MSARKKLAKFKALVTGLQNDYEITRGGCSGRRVWRLDTTIGSFNLSDQSCAEIEALWAHFRKGHAFERPVYVTVEIDDPALVDELERLKAKVAELEAKLRAEA